MSSFLLEIRPWWVTLGVPPDGGPAYSGGIWLKSMNSLYLLFAKGLPKKKRNKGKKQKTTSESLRTIVWVGPLFERITKIAIGYYLGKKLNFIHISSYTSNSFIQMKYFKM